MEESNDGEEMGEAEWSERKLTTQVLSKAFQEEIQRDGELECDGPAGPEMHDETIGFNLERKVAHQCPLKSSLEVANVKLNKAQQQATAPDQSSQETRAMSNNHDADTHDDRAGGSHVVCLDHNGGMELDEKVYWRFSYMFNWLQAAGWSITDAYTAFQFYQGKKSYEQLNLQPPSPKPRDEDCASEWSHMSDYDTLGRPSYVR